MRILHFYKTYYPDTMGGVEQMINQLARATVSLGIQTDVLSLSQNPRPPTVDVNGHASHRVKNNFEVSSMACSLSVFSRFSELIKQADLVHYHYPWPFMDIVHFATRVKIPTVVTYHSDIVRQKMGLQLYRPLKHRFLSSVGRIVATSSNYLDTSPVLSRYRDNTEVIPIGIDPQSYPKSTPQLLKKWQMLIGQRFFLFVGMLRYYKGLHILLEAMKGTQYPVVILGSGPLENALKTQAELLGLEHIHFVGAVSNEDKAALFELCYAVVFPSHLRSEAFGISLLEGAMYGKPMISCEIGTGTSFINVDKKTGLVIEPSNPKALQDAMRILWDKPRLAEAMGLEAKKRYLEIFTASRMAESYSDLYNHLVHSYNKKT